MTQYRQEEVLGTKYQRSFRVEFDNPLNSVPSATFHEESVVVLSDGNSVTTPVGKVSGSLIDPASEFALINPETFEPLGQTMTYQDIYVLLVSLYIHLASIRDNQV